MIDLLLALVGALPQQAVPRAAASPCPVDSGPARPFGPARSQADSGQVYASLLSPDGAEFYFFEHVGPGAEDYRIFRSRRIETGWAAPAVLDLGPSPSDLYPSLSPDGQRLVFASYRPAPGDTSAHQNAHLWMASRTPTGWTPPVFIPASRLGFYHSGLTQDSAGNVFYSLTTPDWRHTDRMRLGWSHDAFASHPDSVPEPAVAFWRGQLGDSVLVWGAVTGPDGLALVQISRVLLPGRHRAPATYFITRWRDGRWSPLMPAGGGLGSGSPNFAWFSRDGCDVHYTRDYSGFMRVSVSAALRPPSATTADSSLHQ